MTLKPQLFLFNGKPTITKYHNFKAMITFIEWKIKIKEYHNYVVAYFLKSTFKLLQKKNVFLVQQKMF